MKIVTKLTVVATLATFMFAGINLTWGNSYTDAPGLTATPAFGVWMDVNDAMSFGWETSGATALPLKVGFAGPGGMTVRLGFDPQDADGADIRTSLGMSNTWWSSTGDGWGTSLSTAIDWGVAGAGEGDFTMTMNLGFGF